MLFVGPVLRIRTILIRIQDVKNSLGFRIRAKSIRIRIQAKKDSVPGKSIKFDNKRSFPMFCKFILLNNHFSINNHLNYNRL